MYRLKKIKEHAMFTHENYQVIISGLPNCTAVVSLCISYQVRIIMIIRGGGTKKKKKK